MNNKEFLIWKAGLAKLTPGQKATLISSMKTLGMEIDEKEDPSDDWLLKGILMAMRKHGLLYYSSLDIKKSKAFQQYKLCAPRLLKRLSKVAGKSTSAQSSLAYLCGVALIKWCERHCSYPVKDGPVTIWRNRPLTRALILSNTKNLLLAIEEQFPGYLKANILHIIVAGQSCGGQTKRTLTGINSHSLSVRQQRRLHRGEPVKS